MSKVSVIVPIYNVEEYIEECVRSIIAQSYKDIEIILVDDCGNDNSVQIAENILNDEAHGKFSFVVLHHEKNRGLSAARNTGVEVASGDYVYFMDSDDTITPDCIEKLVYRAESTGADIVVGGINVVGNSPTIPSLDNEIVPFVLDNPADVLNSYIYGKWYMMAWNKLIKRRFLTENNITFIEGLIHEDYAWSFDVASSAKSVAFVGEETYNYLIRENSLQTAKDFTKHCNAYLQILKVLAEIIIKKGIVAQTSSWFEKQKALLFSMTLQNGSAEQVKNIYSVIHNILPIRKFTKVNSHYLLPEVLGIHLYKKFHRYHLC